MQESAFSHVVVGIDFSKPSRVALRRATDLAVGLEARLDVLHIVPRNQPAVPFSRANREAARRIEREEIELAQEKLAGWAPKRAGLDVRTRVASGSPSVALLSYVRKVSADLLVVANAGHGAVHDLLLGSTADHVLRRSPVPVLVVPTAGRGRG